MKKEDWLWGRSSSLDLHGCDNKLLKNPKTINHFVRQLCKILKMKKIGPTNIKRFGHSYLRGYSAMQFIEASTIVAHFDEKGNRAFIDIFSCKMYNPKTIANFCKKFFKAENCSVYVEERL